MRKFELEKKIKDLNDWLLNPINEKSADYKQKLHDRNYYVNRLIELEEYGQ